MDATSYLVLTNSASKRTLFPSNDKENESDDSIGHMSPLSSSPDRYSSPVASPKWSSPLTGTPSPLRSINGDRALRSRHDTWQLRNFTTPLKFDKTRRVQKSPKLADNDEISEDLEQSTLKSDLVDETPEKDIQTKVLISPFSCLVKENETPGHRILETPDTSSVRKAIFTPLKDYQKRSDTASELKTNNKPIFELSNKSEPVTISKRTFYKSFPKARTSLFSNKPPARVPPTIPAAKKRPRSPSGMSMKTNYSQRGSGNRFLKRRKAGEINSGVYHRIKRPKLKHVEAIKLPKITPRDRVEEYLAKKVIDVMKPPEHTMDVEQLDGMTQTAPVETPHKISVPIEKREQSPPTDPSKKFFKTNRTLAINRKATVSFVENVKIQVSNGKFSLKNSEIKSKPCAKPLLQKKTDIPKNTENVFEDMVVEPVPETVKESVQSILKSLVEETVEEGIQNQLQDHPCKEISMADNEDVEEKPQSAPRQLVDNQPIGPPSESEINKLPSSPNQSIISITVSTSSLILDDGVDLEHSREAPDSSLIPSGEKKEGKLFPIFYKNENTDVKSSKTVSPILKKTPKCAKKWKQTGSDQYIIDAGQKRFGATQCKECGIVYNSGDAEDEISHYNLHNNIQSLKFTGWTEEHVVYTYSDGRVIIIQPNDSKRKLNKMKEVLDVVDRELGIVDPDLKHLDVSKVYLFINNKSVVGCLVAHPRSEAYKMLNVGVDDIDCCSVETYPVKCGVSRIWTAKNHRKKGIATRLMDCVRLSFMYGHVLDRDEIAFSVPTKEGKAFAEKYTGTPNFLVYN
ncbi:N-acetyltransferase ESCO2 [Anabrus simplex]|uniref:N-acetyltransferase ESCO2 n=1 Tax=Anabrus simplex TaxID=316456 RepID=UPI0035A2866D